MGWLKEEGVAVPDARAPYLRLTSSPVELTILRRAEPPEGNRVPVLLRLEVMADGLTYVWDVSSKQLLAQLDAIDPTRPVQVSRHGKGMNTSYRVVQAEAGDA